MARIKKNNNKKRQELPEDTQWCLSNLPDLTTRKFFDQFSHKYKSVQQISRRYKNIINSELKGVRNIVNIRDEHSMWMKSKMNTSYWLEKIRDETITNTEGANFDQDVVTHEINSANLEEDAVTDGEATAEINEEEPWILENGINVTSLFTIYFERVRQLIEMEGLIHIETHENYQCDNLAYGFI
ncbi:unnamed protein product [Mucor hiemalis]